jgi:hypothetical protein
MCDRGGVDSALLHAIPLQAELTCQDALVFFIGFGRAADGTLCATLPYSVSCGRRAATSDDAIVRKLEDDGRH